MKNTGPISFSLRARLLILIFTSVLGVSAVFSYMLIAVADRSRTVNAELLDRANKMALTADAAFIFKTEVQAWKNILIRGSKEAQFIKNSAELTEKSHLLKEKVVALQKIVTDPNDQALIDSFSKAESSLYQHYQDAIAAHLKPEHFDYPAETFRTFS